MKAYQLNAGGSAERLAILRKMAADSVNNRNESTRLNPGNWKGARHYTLGSYAAAHGTFDYSAAGHWYCHAGEYFRNERDAHEIIARLPRGWYTDSHQDETAIGIVARLPHGRFIAGYRWTSNDERVYFPDVFDDETLAARMADRHAESFADSAREDDERYNAAVNLESKISDACTELTRAFALRNHPKRRDFERETVGELIETIRADRETLKTEFKGIL